VSIVALQHRNFRLLWIGLLISFSGSLMQSAAILWHVSLLVPEDKRALALGMVGLVRVVPIIFFSLLSGVAADVFNRRKLMLVTQSIMAIFAAALAALTWRGLDAVWPVYLLSALSSSAGAFDLPARQALTPNLVPREHLANALTLNTIMFQVAAVVGPAVGGIVIGHLGVAWAYAINAVSFVVVIAALLMMKDVERQQVSDGSAADPVKKTEFTLHAALEGLRFVFRFHSILILARSLGRQCLVVQRQIVMSDFILRRFLQREFVFLNRLGDVRPVIGDQSESGVQVAFDLFQLRLLCRACFSHHGADSG